MRTQASIIKGRWRSCEALDCAVLVTLFEDAVPQVLFTETRHTRIALASGRNHEDVQAAAGVEVKVKSTEGQKA